MTQLMNRRRALPVLVAVALAWPRWSRPRIVWQGEQDRDAKVRADVADRAAADMRRQFDTTVDGLATIQTFFASSEKITGREFDTLRRRPAARLAGGLHAARPARAGAAARRRSSARPAAGPSVSGWADGCDARPAREDYFPVSYRYTRLEHASCRSGSTWPPTRSRARR